MKNHEEEEEEEGNKSTTTTNPLLGGRRRRRRYYVALVGSLCLLFVAGALYDLSFLTNIVIKQQVKIPTLSSSSSSPSSSSPSSLEEEEVAAVLPTGQEVQEENFSQALQDFTTLLHDDPEKYALRPWTWRKPQQQSSSSSSSTSSTLSSSTLSIHFDGLSLPLLHDALGNKRILLLGDSTMFYLQVWLQRLLLKTTPYTVNALQTLNLTLANHLVYDKYDTDQFLACNRSNVEIHLHNSNSSTAAGQQQQQHDIQQKASSSSFDIVWRGIRDRPSPQSCQVQHLWNATIQLMRPHVVVVNMGLHWLHLVHNTTHALRNESPCTVRLVMHYEAWLQDIVKMVRLSGSTKLLLFKTTNFICTDLYRDQFAATVNLFQQERQRLFEQDRSNNSIPDSSSSSSSSNSNNATKGNDVFHNCMSYFIKKKQQLLHEIIYKYCRTATFDEVGVTHLNQRLMNFVVAQQQQQQHDSLKIRIFNDHDLQSCRYSRVRDGRHYHALKFDAHSIVGQYHSTHLCCIVSK